MSWLKSKIRNWLASDDLNAIQGHVFGQHTGLLSTLADTDNPATLTVVPIEKGFLVMQRVYSGTGPDKINATFAADTESLNDVLVSKLVQARMKI